ncbi:PREDICTED: BAG domain-containing protein Samui-like isoform X1 [Papilio xuthus]|uniref:BAG domain-containing protein Samui-like isoform X1 n=1 Tax=Papilio xuthus TaxID=66420 RepID=A0AAJ6ZH09_PAPXU|nr:PREDICTED: BAG domain-containing protein Samui-like isoform X1 [Papilio xuthus]
MESPVVVDKPPEYHGRAAKNNQQRGFPFDEEEGSGAWSELAARHPDIAARLRQRPATWARKRRPSSQDATDDFDDFSGFDRFPFDDIPSEFREHFPSHWNRRFGSREEAPPPSPPQPQSPQQQSAATQTDCPPGPSAHAAHTAHTAQDDQHTHLPQYGLRNTVDLGQKSPADPSLVDEEDRTQRSMSAPPDNRTAGINNANKMSGQNHQEQSHNPHSEQQSNVRHIPIFVEGRDEPVINKGVDHATHFGDTKPAYVPPPQPHIDRDQYFADDGPVNFHAPPNFSRAFGTPFNKGFRQGPQPFVQQKVYPQAAFARGASPQRSQSPKPQMPPEEHYVKVPVHHEQTAPRAETPSRPQQKQPPRQSTPPTQPPTQPPPQRHTPTPPPQPKPQPPPANDPKTQILAIQTDVLNLMSDVENFTGTKKDKRYLYLDEMLTRNLIKLDNIETEGKENIRQARKEAIRCIQKCIAVLEAKAEKGSNAAQQQDVEMENPESQNDANDDKAVENGEVEMKDVSKEQPKAEAQMVEANTEKPKEDIKQEEVKDQPKDEEPKDEKIQENAKIEASESTEVAQPQIADTRPEEQVKEKTPEIKSDEQKQNENLEKEMKSPKKGTKNIKKRDKSKDKKDATNDSIKDSKTENKQEDKKDSTEQKENKEEKKEEEEKKDADVNVEQKKDIKIESMQVDGKGDKTEPQTMDVDNAAASQ